MKKEIIVAALAVLPAIAHANWQPDKISLAYGQFISPLSDRHAEIGQYRLGLGWNLADALWSSDTLRLESYAELGLSNWKSSLNPAPDSRRTGADNIWQISISPVFRLTGTNPLFGKVSPFFDVGVGISYQSEKDIEQQHLSGINMGGHLQFEIRTMIGSRFGDQMQYELSAGWFHYSNANLHEINEALDFAVVQLGYGW